MFAAHAHNERLRIFYINCLLSSHQIWRNLALSIPVSKPNGVMDRCDSSVGFVNQSLTQTTYI